MHSISSSRFTLLCRFFSSLFFPKCIRSHFRVSEHIFVCDWLTRTWWFFIYFLTKMKQEHRQQLNQEEKTILHWNSENKHSLSHWTKNGKSSFQNMSEESEINERQEKRMKKNKNNIQHKNRKKELTMFLSGISLYWVLGTFCSQVDVYHQRCFLFLPALYLCATVDYAYANLLHVQLDLNGNKVHDIFFFKSKNLLRNWIEKSKMFFSFSQCDEHILLSTPSHMANVLVIVFCSHSPKLFFSSFSVKLFSVLNWFCCEDENISKRKWVWLDAFKLDHHRVKQWVLWKHVTELYAKVYHSCNAIEMNFIFYLNRSTVLKEKCMQMPNTK